VQLPPEPDYLRVKVRRRLRRIGAAAVKHTVYVLPNTDEALEDFQWLREEVEAAGGTAIIVEARFVDGIGDEEVSAMIEAERGTATAGEPGVARTVDHVEPGRTWVTRQGVFVDRIASAWLIRRFIDRVAKFRFVPARSHDVRPDEIRFDMVGGEYTHVGGDCTFQTLCRRFDLDAPGLAAVAEVVHDIDCKDERFGRAEAAGIAGVLRGIADASTSDQERIERGRQVFDDLLAFYARPDSRRRAARD